MSGRVLLFATMSGCYGTPSTTLPDGGITPCDAAVPAAPTLTRPMRGAYSGSLHAQAALATLRPTFSWAPVASACGAVTYQIQVDDSCVPGALATCAFPSPELDVNGIATTSHVPASDLKVSAAVPVGAFYAWRVRACDPSARCGTWSEVRYLHVGRVREDINGDGYGDLLAISNRGIEAYLGKTQFDVSAPTKTIAYTGWSAPSFAGDVNGDGYGDLFGGISYAPTSGLAPTVFFGGPDVTNLGTTTLTKTTGGPSTMMQTTSAGDMNGDGFADLIVQWAYSNTTPKTELRVFFGGTTLANTPDLSIPGPYMNDYTLNDSGRMGDLNGDGFEDIALTAMSDEAKAGGLVQIFAGGLHPTATAINVPISASTQYQVEPVGDVDADGFDDAVVFLPGSHYALYRGAATLPTTTAMTWTDATTSSAAGGFDIDRDGRSDFVVGTTASAPLLYRGTGATASQVSGGLSRLAWSLAVGVSDHDGDGRPDFVGVSGRSDTGSASIQWAGSDGTTNPRVFYFYLPATAMFNGQLVR